MIVLFVNAHRPNSQGQSRFDIYYKNIKHLLRQTVYYGKDIQEIVRKSNQLQDFIYDQNSYRIDKKARQKFQSVQYVFIDGNISTCPWSPHMKQVLLLIRMCTRTNKKFHFNGYAHSALYFYMTTNFQKDFIISNKKMAKEAVCRHDYQYNQQNGDLTNGEKRCIHSGIRCVKIHSGVFNSKSSQAINQGIILPTKFHYVVFDSKNGNKILNDIKFPFSFFCKGRIFCSPKQISQAKVEILVQTEDQTPLAYTYKDGLSTHGLSTQFLQIISNWLYQKTGFRRSMPKRTLNQLQSVSTQNQLSYKKSLLQIQSKSEFLNVRPNTSKIRPKTSKFSQPFFEKPSVRCSGPYQTECDQLNAAYQASRVKFMGKSRMIFKSDMDKNQISNYVSQTPSRPPSSHKFRQVLKDKWISKSTFFVV